MPWKPFHPDLLSRWLAKSVESTRQLRQTKGYSAAGSNLGMSREDVRNDVSKQKARHAEGCAGATACYRGHTTLAQNQMIVSSVHRLSFFLVPDSDHGHDMDEIPEYLPFTNLLTLQARIAHLYHDVIEARTIQRWRLPRIAALIQNNPCLEHLAIDTCNLEVPSWDVLFSHISGLKQLHTLVLCDAVIATQVPNFLDEGALSIDSPIRESQTMIQSLKRLYLEGVEPELELIARYGYTLLLGDIMNWLTEDKVPSLQHLHLTAHSLPVAAFPSLQLITADFTISEYGFTSQEGTKCLETNFPESFGTGILKYRQMLEWWQI
ncbi:hypothetical protein EV359DRAFT_64979 [Lentinula novae-zelandiae]|nr:hypothetical protein EV359DRAFT_64979 [Lentinula novae-zelandiae]